MENIFDESKYMYEMGGCDLDCAYSCSDSCYTACFQMGSSKKRRWG